MLRPGTGNRGSTLAAALALAFLIFAVTTISVGRVAGGYRQVTMRHNQTTALFLAEAGVQSAGAHLLANRAYSGEQGTRLETGSFDTSVTPGDGGYVVRSTGHADSALGAKPRTTVQATIRLSGRSFRVVNWRENP